MEARHALQYGKAPLGGLIRSGDEKMFGMTNEAGKNGNGGTVYMVVP